MVEVNVINQLIDNRAFAAYGFINQSVEKGST
jgi:hypothetical protein